MSKIPVAVELYYSGAWHDIVATDDVYTRDAIRISRGRPNWLTSMPPSRCDLSIENRDAKYSLRNPMSVLYGLIGRNTPIRVSVKRAQDAFTRTLADSWGTSTFGQAYTLAGDSFSAANYDVNGSQGTIQPGGTGLRRFATVDTNATDFDVEVEIAIGSTPASGTLSQGVVGRFTDTNHHYLARVQVSTTSTVTLLIDRRFTGITSNIATVLTSLTHVNGAYKTIRFRGDGPYLWAKVWDTGTAEPSAWTLSITDTVITTTGSRVGAYAINDTAVTTHVFSFDNLIERDIRFTGEIESWPQRWNVKGNDVWAPITAWGIRRRLNAPGTTAPSRSAPGRYIAAQSPRAFWPLEDGPDSTTGSPAPETPAAPAMVPSYAQTAQTVQWGKGELAAWLPPVLAVQGASLVLRAVVPGAAPTTGIAADVSMRQHGADDDAAMVVLGLFKVATQGGNPHTYYISMNWNAGVPELKLFREIPGSASTLIDTATAAEAEAGWDDALHHWRIEATDVGADVTVSAYLDGTLIMSGTHTGASLVAGARLDITSLALTRGVWGYAVAWVDTIPSVTAAAAATHGHAGELAANRITRLCTEDGIAVSILGTAIPSEPLGPQRAAPFLELLQDAADADGGPLYEPREFLGFAYRTHRSLYSQTPVVTLDYSAGGEVAPPLEPIEDTDTIVNDVTVTRYLGSSSQVVKETGTLNVQEPSDDPPNGVGRYAKDFPLVLATDSQTYQQAAWRRNVGTWDEARYTVLMDLTAMEVAGKTALIWAAASLDIGDRLAITNLPEQIGFDGTEQHAQGFVETIESHLRSIAANATPAGPFSVGVLDDTVLGRLDNDACTLNEALDTTETGVDVVSVNTPWGSQFPYDINIGGERMTVTGRSGAGLSQTLTVTRSVNGVVKSHASGAPVRLFNPLRLAR